MKRFKGCSARRLWGGVSIAALRRLLLDARLKVLLTNVVGAGVARLVNLLVTVCMVPLAVEALSRADYAYFAMAIAASTFVSFADLGMGLAVVNAVAQRGARPRSSKAQRAISVVWFALFLFAALTVVICALLAAALPGTAALRAMLAAIACVSLALPTILVQRILFAEQKNVQANAWNTATRLAALAMTWLVARSPHADLMSMTLAATAAPTAVGWVSAWALFRAPAMRGLRPHRALVRRRVILPYMRLGFAYMIMQLVPYVEIGIDALLIAGAIGVALVQPYDVYSKLFNYIPALVSLAAFPMWPAIANARAAGDYAWVARAQRLGLIGVLAAASVAGMTVAVAAPSLAGAWTGLQLQLPATSMPAMGALAALGSLGSLQSLMLSGVGVIAGQVRIALIYIVALVAGKWLAARYLGLAAMLWWSVAAAIAKSVAMQRLLRGGPR